MVNILNASTEHTWNIEVLRLRTTQRLVKVGRIRRPISRVLCPSFAEASEGGGHSSGPCIAARFSRPTRTARAGDGPALASQGAPSLFGLAPGGACHAVPVTRSAVGSYRTLSPLPSGRGLPAVCFLWRFPWARARRALPAALSPWSPDFPRPPLRETATARPSDPPRTWSRRRRRSTTALVNRGGWGEKCGGVGTLAVRSR